MPIQVRKVTRPLWLREFADEYDDEKLDVWVNPTRELLADYSDIYKETKEFLKRLNELGELKESDLDQVSDAEKKKLHEQMTRANDRTFAWYSEIWGQGELQVTTEEVKELSTRCQEEDPALWDFLLTRTWALINDHRGLSKKG